MSTLNLYSSYSNMAEGVGSVVDNENGSFQNQITRHLPRKASQAAISVWKPLCAKKSPRGDPRAGVAKRSIQRASKFMRMSMTKRRTAASLAESATKELQSLAEFMPNLADTDAIKNTYLAVVLHRIDGWLKTFG